MMLGESKKPNVTLRKFEYKDIPDKVRWINNPLVNRYLHYELPLEVKKTENWFLANRDNFHRYDAVILANGRSVGLIGLISIDYQKRAAEYYIALGEPDCFGKGIAYEASRELIRYAFCVLSLNRLYLSTEADNQRAIRLYERIGFTHGKDSFENNVRKVNYSLDRADYHVAFPTPIMSLEGAFENDLYIKRDDLLPFSFGGNKVRKAAFFFREVDRGDYSCIVTYGSSSSNHCRVVANMAAKRNLPCYIISPSENAVLTNNSKMMKLFGSNIIMTSVTKVHDTIEELLLQLTADGEKPYFIYGGGHGNIGTSAYVDCYWEIKSFEKENGIFFDNIFLASGTGTTQAGLVCGMLLAKDRRNIIGISIARTNPRGRNIVIDSIRDYLTEKRADIRNEELEKATIFCDDYVAGGYAKSSPEIDRVIDEMLILNGIPLDRTYTGKAFFGMLEYLKKNRIRNQKILFIHTGGTPLFFDYFANNGICQQNGWHIE